MDTKKVNEFLKEHMRFGDVTKVARKHGMTHSYVSNIKSGKISNMEILESLVEVAATRKKEKEEHQNRVEEAMK